MTISNAAQRDRESARKTNGRFGEQSHSAAAVSLTVPELLREAAVTTVVSDAVASGLLRPVSALNGGERYQSGDILLGRTASGERVFAELSMEFIPKTARNWETLEENRGYWQVSMTGSTIEKGRRSVSHAGQITETVADVADGALTPDEALELSELWEDQHLNGMQAGTPKQKTEAKLLHEQGHGTGYILDNVAEDNGYRYGSAWLVKPADPTKVARIVELLEQADN